MSVAVRFNGLLGKKQNVAEKKINKTTNKGKQKASKKDREQGPDFPFPF